MAAAFMYLYVLDGVASGGGGDTPNAALLSPQFGIGLGIGYGI